MFRRDREEGQATVELALALPILAVILAAMLEAGMIGLDQLRLWHAAREAARIAVVDPNLDEIREAAERSGLAPLDVTVEPDTYRRTSGGPLTVRLAYQPSGHVPLIGAIVDDVTLGAEATMRIERP
jgi:hypothetical protein